MKTLNEQYQLIKNNKGHKGVFLTEAKRQFPNYIPNVATFDETALILKQKGIINENIVGLTAINSPFESKKESYELAFDKFLEEAKKKETKSQEETEKAELKTPSKQVEDDLKHGFDTSDKSNPNNLIFDQVMRGYYAEMKDPKNGDKTMDQLKAIVFKNLEKDPMHYVKDGQFGVKDLGYTTEAPGLGTPKEAKGKYKSSGYGDLKEGMIGKNYPDFITGEIEGEPVRIDGSDLHDMLVSGLEYNNTPESFIKYIEYGVTDETSELSDEDKQKLATWYNQNKDTNLQEVKLRKVIREIIDEELEEAKGGGNYGMMTVNTSNKGGGGRRYIPNEAFMSQETIDKFNFSNPGPNAPTRPESLQIPHIKFLAKPTGSVMLISDFLYNAINQLERGRTSREKEMGKNELEKLISQLDPMVRALIKKKVDPKMSLGNYHVVDMPFEREKGVGIKIPLDREEIAEMMLNENVDKRLKEIESEAAMEAMGSKLEKIVAEIEKRQMQLGKLDEDEDLKAMMDKKATSKIQKEIKLLEKAKSKVEKIMGKSKGKKKEVIDEIEEDEANPEFVKALNQAEEMYHGGLDIETILVKFNPRMRDDLRRHLEMGFEGTDND
jgi:hypothetical protein